MWTDEQEGAYKKMIRGEILKAFRDAEGVKKPSVENMFSDVYFDDGEGLVWNLEEQRREMWGVVGKWEGWFDVDAFEKK